MRRRTIISCLLAAAALAGASVAIADPPATTLAYPALTESPDAQNGPAVAVNPTPGSSTEAIVAASDWRGGGTWLQTAFANAPIQSVNGATSWHDNGILPPTTGNSPDIVSGGSPSVAWGPGNTVFIAQVGRSSASPTSACDPAAGLYLSVSTDGGNTFGQPLLLVSGGPNAQITEPSIAYSAAPAPNGRIYVAYTKTTPCGGGPSSLSAVRMVSTSDFTTANNRLLSDISGTTALFGRPSIAALPNGNVAVAYYDETLGAVDVSVCDTSSGAPACPGRATATLDAAASDSGAFPGQGVYVGVRPTIAASPLAGHARVVVAWAKTPIFGGASSVYSATSMDLGAHFGAAQAVTPPAGYQFDPAVAVSAGDRADIAFLDSTVLPSSAVPSALGVSVSASNAPISAVAWSPPQGIEGTAINQILPAPISQPSLGGRLGIAELPPANGHSWTLVAWTDTRNASAPNNEDIYSTVLKHQSTVPVALAMPPQPVPKNATQAVPFGQYLSDADADPLTYTIAADGNLGHASIPDANVPSLLYTANPVKGPDSVQVTASDGVNSTTLTVPLSLVNVAPTIGCASLTTTRDKPITFAATGCGLDRNGDALTYTASSPTNGTITGAGPTLAFTPRDTGQASVVLTVSDGELSSPPTTVPITVLPPPPVRVDLLTKDVVSTRTDRPVLFAAKAEGDAVPRDEISWDFGDGTTDSGGSVSHMFTAAHRTYMVSARIGDGVPALVKVFVLAPPVSIRDTSLLHEDTIKVRLRLVHRGTLSARLIGVAGSRALTSKMKPGSHTLRLPVPAAARHRGTIVVRLALTQTNGAVVKLRRAVLLPRR